MATQTYQLVQLALRKSLAVILAHEQELGRLDAAAGDGDHGAAMVRGLRAAVQAADSAGEVKAGVLLAAVGTAFADAGGGASGALFGAWLTTIGQQLGAAPDDATVLQALQAGLAMLGKLGKAQPGDKTMLDTLAPFVGALKEALAAGKPLPTAWAAALAAAEAGAAATAQMVARRGRSSRLGERSLGHQDPGAVSMLYLLQATGAALTETCGVA